MSSTLEIALPSSFINEFVIHLQVTDHLGFCSLQKIQQPIPILSALPSPLFQTDLFLKGRGYNQSQSRQHMWWLCLGVCCKQSHTGLKRAFWGKEFSHVLEEAASSLPFISVSVTKYSPRAAGGV